jgi:hypothetical protein
METKVKVQQMFERLSCDFPYNSLANIREYGVEELAKDCRANTGSSVYRLA